MHSSSCWVIHAAGCHIYEPSSHSRVDMFGHAPPVHAHTPSAYSQEGKVGQGVWPVEEDDYVIVPPFADAT